MKRRPLHHRLQFSLKGIGLFVGTLLIGSGFLRIGVISDEFGSLVAGLVLLCGAVGCSIGYFIKGYNGAFYGIAISVTTLFFLILLAVLIIPLACSSR